MSLATRISEYIFVLATGASTILLLYLITRRSVRGVVRLIFLLASSLLWMTAAVREISAPTFEERIFWHKFGEMSFAWCSLTWFVFCLQFVEQQVRITWSRYLPLGSLIPLVFTLLIWTNDRHHLFWIAFRSSQQPTFAALDVTLGPAGVACQIYNYGIGLVILVLLILELLVTKKHWRKILILILCTVTPGIALLTQLFGGSVFHVITPTPYIYIICISLILWGLIRYRLLNVFPIPYPPRYCRNA